jgi:hypothetical protein
MQNCINQKSRGNTPIALLGQDVDLSQVIRSTIQIDKDSDPATLGIPPVKSSLEDINGDGKLDLLLHFDTQELNRARLLNVSGQRLYITGQLANGELVIGSDVIRLVGVSACSTQ